MKGLKHGRFMASCEGPTKVDSIVLLNKSFLTNNALHFNSQDEELGDIQFRKDEANLLGRGSKGNKVYRGTLRSSGKHVAVKVTYAGIFDEKEGRRLRELQHPNIIKCFAIETRGDYICLALELCQKTLTRCVEENEFARLDSSVKRLRCLKEITVAVEYLHERRICHRDIKPDNILLSASDPPRFILADFNTAKTENSTQGLSAVGTEGYIAPEAYKPHDKIIFETDIFSLGCVFYYTLTDGKGHPFGSVETLKKCQRNIYNAQPPSLVEADFLEHPWTKPIIKRMISFHPDQRLSATDVMKALEVRT